MRDRIKIRYELVYRLECWCSTVAISSVDVGRGVLKGFVCFVKVGMGSGFVSA